MRIKHIYITKEGEPMANPEMDMPYMSHYVLDDDGRERYYDAMKYWNSGLLPFEDNEKVKDELFHQVTGGPQVDVPFNVMFKPGTLIPVELDVEVVEQTREIGEEKWNDGNYDNTIFKYHRKVLRIKP